MRVGFVLLDEGWLGGVHYLLNLVSALRELPGRPVRPVLLVGPRVSAATLDKFGPFLDQAPVRCDSDLLLDAKLPILPLIKLRAEPLEQVLKRHKVELLFHQGLMVGSRFSVPTLGWIPDFQHRRLPRMFGPLRFARREMLFQFLVDESTRIMVSSEAAREDCECLYQRTRGRVTAVPFAIRPADPTALPPRDTLRAKYDLPDRFFFLPNQLWRHKNHLAIITALRHLPKEVVVVATGNLHDQRDPRHPRRVRDLVHQFGLESRFRLLGQVPYADVLGLLVNAHGLVNPSLFEGWSTTVEEAKAYGVPMILSHLTVHQEQAEGHAQFFDPMDTGSVTAALQAAWELPRPDLRIQEALEDYQPKRVEFANAFSRLARRCQEDGA